MRARTLAAAGLLAAAALAVTACSSAGPAATFTPGGGGQSAAGGQAPAAAVASGGYVMPPFGTNVHVEMTPWLPANTAQAQAVNADKDYQLAYLYAQYKGGQDQSWMNYVSPAMQTGVEQSLQASDVTTESFIGTIKYFDMSVIPDPLVKGEFDVSTCFDDAGASDTSLTTGKVIADTSSADSHYVLVTEELNKDSAGQWEVVASLPTIYYPQAAQCKS